MNTIGLCTGHEEAQLCRAQTCSQEPGGQPGTSNPEPCCQKMFQQRKSAAEAESSEEKSEKQQSHGIMCFSEKETSSLN